MFFSICVWINDWVNNREAGDLRRHRGHHDVNVMIDVVVETTLIAANHYKVITVTTYPIKWLWMYVTFKVFLIVHYWRPVLAVTVSIKDFAPISAALARYEYHIALVQMMDWRRTGNKPLSEPMMVEDVTGTSPKLDLYHVGFE